MVNNTLRLNYARYLGLNEVDIRRLCEALDEGDADNFATAGYPAGAGLDLVELFKQELYEKGMLPAALVHALVGCKNNTVIYTSQQIEWMLKLTARLCGLDAIRTVGDDPGYDDPEKIITLYRGISGAGQRRKVRGLSWTSDLDTACWFALWKKLRNPAIYMATVQMKEVFCYITDRDESEFIVRPDRPKRLDITREEMEQGSDRHREKLQQAHKMLLSA